MNHEKLIECKRCGSDACFLTEVNETLNTQLCFGCGFVTNSYLKPNSPYLEEQIEILPNLYKELIVEDEDGNIWMPNIINNPTKGMLFAKGTSIQDWKWAAVKATKIEEEEKEKFPIPNKKGEYYSQKMDMTTLKEFPEKDYIEALDYLGLLNP
jgi:hypothetical protein